MAAPEILDPQKKLYFIFTAASMHRPENPPQSNLRNCSSLTSEIAELIQNFCVCKMKFGWVINTGFSLSRHVIKNNFILNLIFIKKID